MPSLRIGIDHFWRVVHPGWTWCGSAQTMEGMSEVSGNSEELVQAVVTLLRAVSTGPAAPTPRARRLLRVAEVADRLAISEAHVYALIRSGDIRSVKLGAARRIAPSEVDRIMASSEAS